MYGRVWIRRASSIIAKRADETKVTTKTMTDHVTVLTRTTHTHAYTFIGRLCRRSTPNATRPDTILTMTSIWTCEQDHCGRRATLYGGGCRRCSLHLCPDHHWDVEIHPCVTIDEEVKDEIFATTEDTHVGSRSLEAPGGETDHS